MRHLVEEVEAGRRVLHLDRVEVEVGGEPADAVDRTAEALGHPLGAPEGMGGDRDAALVVDLVDRRGGAQAGADPALEEEPEDVALPAGDLLTDDHRNSGRPRAVLDRPKGALDRVVVGDGDHIEVGFERNVINHLRRRRPAVAEGRMKV